jgi:ATP-dependent exoDNAse (exonuclease V) alpha subunit
MSIVNQTQETILRGKIEKVFYVGPKFSAGRLRDEDGRSSSFAGHLFAVEGLHVALAGHWETHPDYGQQFKVDHVEVEMPGDPEGLARYIANHPEVKGIGPTRAAKIAHAFGEDFEDALLNSPERIAEVAKVPVSIIDNLRAVWMTSRRFNAVMTWLSAFGLTHHQAGTLIEKLGNNAQAVLEDKPCAQSLERARLSSWRWKLSDRAESPFGEEVDLIIWQIQQGIKDSRSELQQIERLGDSCPGHAEVFSQFCLGGIRTLFEKSLKDERLFDWISHRPYRLFGGCA